MESKVLVMTFKNAQGKKVNVRLGNIKEGLTDAQVANAMDVVLSSNILLTTGGDIAAKEDAQIVTTNTSPFTVK